MTATPPALVAVGRSFMRLVFPWFSPSVQAHKKAGKVSRPVLLLAALYYPQAAPLFLFSCLFLAL